MTNIQKIKFDSKYSVYYNGNFYTIAYKLSSYNLYVNEEEFNELFIDYNLSELNKEEFEIVVKEFKEVGEFYKKYPDVV